MAQQTDRYQEFEDAITSSNLVYVGHGRVGGPCYVAYHRYPESPTKRVMVAMVPVNERSNKIMGKHGIGSRTANWAAG